MPVGYGLRRVLRWLLMNNPYLPILCSSLSVVVSLFLLTIFIERWADIFCVSILGMSVYIRPRATTYFLLDSSCSFLPPSRRLHSCSKPTIFDHGPPLNITAMKRDEAMVRVLHSSTMARSGDNKNYEYLEQGFWSVTTLLANT